MSQYTHQAHTHRHGSIRSLRGQRGVGSLEYIAIAAFVITSIVMGMRWYGMYDDFRTDASTADQFKQALPGAKNYVDANIATLQTQATTVVPWAALAPYMPTGLSSTNPFGQSYQLVVQRVGAVAPFTFNALLQTVVTASGKPIPEGRLRRISQLIGGAGGYVSAIAPSTATGAYSGWSAALPYGGAPGANPGTGTLAGALFYQTAASMNNAYLWRNAVPGHPELNQMNTAIDMQNNNIANANQVTAKNVVLPGGTTLQIGSSYYYGDPTNSAIRQAGALYVQHVDGSMADAHVSSLGASLDVSAGRNIWAAGSVSASGDISSGGNIWAAGAVTTAWLHSTGSAQIDGSQQVNGNINTGGRITSGEYLQAGGWANAGAGCGPAGLVGQNGSQTLLCSNGTWTAPGGLSQSNCGWTAIPGGGSGPSGFFSYTCPWGWYIAGYGNYREGDWTRTGEAQVFCCSAT